MVLPGGIVFVVEVKGDGHERVWRARPGKAVLHGLRHLYTGGVARAENLAAVDDCKPSGEVGRTGAGLEAFKVFQHGADKSANGCERERKETEPRGAFEESFYRYRRFKVCRARKAWGGSWT